MCPSFSSAVVVECPDPKQLRRGSLFRLKIPGYSPLWWGSQGRGLKVAHIKSSQEQRDVSVCLLGGLLTRLLGSVSPLLHCSGPLPREWCHSLWAGSPHYLLKTIQQACPRPSQSRQPLIDSLFSGDSGLCP